MSNGHSSVGNRDSERASNPWLS